MFFVCLVAALEQLSLFCWGDTFQSSLSSQPWVVHLLLYFPSCHHSQSLSSRDSQNHRMFEVGRDLCGSSGPTPLLKQGHPEQAAQDLVQAGLEYLQRRRLHSLPGQPGPVLHHPQSGEAVAFLTYYLDFCSANSGDFRSYSS